MLLKKIIFDIDVKIEDKTSLIYMNKRFEENPILALRSTICKVSPFNDRYDNILCMFNSENIHQVEFKSLSFFPTHKELLSNAKFTIVDLKTGEQPKWDEGSPTYIHLIVRKRMGSNFNIFVESNDKASKLKFDENSNMEFTIGLPERFRFGDWQVCLKSLIMPSRVWNIYDEAMPKWKFSTNVGEQEGVRYDYGFPQGCYEVDDILTIIQNTLDKFKVPVEVTFNHDKKRVRIKLKRRNLKKEEYYTLDFNGYLNKILGFTIKVGAARYFLTKKYKTIDAPYMHNINAYTPKSFIVTCDIVDQTVFGGEHLKLLRLITNKMDRQGDTIHYDFLHDEYVNLGTHEFEKIKIRICDVTGNLLKAD